MSHQSVLQVRSLNHPLRNIHFPWELEKTKHHLSLVDTCWYHHSLAAQKMVTNSKHDQFCRLWPRAGKNANRTETLPALPESSTTTQHISLLRPVLLGLKISILDQKTNTGDVDPWKIDASVIGDHHLKYDWKILKQISCQPSIVQSAQWTWSYFR